MKNIIICCDGTSNEYGDHNTNVVKLFDAIIKDNDQLAFYDPGVGTFGPKLTGAISGFGISKNIKDAYEYLMNRYEDNSKVFLFGFSRGAFTVRSLAGMIHKCGLLTKGSNNLIDYALEIYQQKDNEKIATGFKQTFGRECKVYFIGVWDTVKALNPISPKFHSAKLNHDVTFGYHALSIDDERLFFHPTLWDENQKASHQTIEQVWFPGVHSDVGGSYKESGLSDIALQWMLDKASAAGLKLKDDYTSAIHQNPFDKLHNSRSGFAWFYPKKIRTIPENSLIHQCVFDRINNTNSNYAPVNLPVSYSTISNTNYHSLI